ncbi:hemin ABC transporter substrate-binding protein [Vibrio brasiliensis]|uniref:heme/hemin ABC transporter substrate-binding protein n=1 Tax=Vibrio brasiliensis TaxID=170652 RepID=UPI001EFE858B|nr:hemin ABC transporter substrate-binding protein [Vibrio brasiliensis]MCG9749955.1 hemin ABC transporter substrate-binding protein [Vibrio brasiliensis]MCG9781876.1 hemin ABC transporter substrate-binding protein [Vibrio brasiliensis]
MNKKALINRLTTLSLCLIASASLANERVISAGSAVTELIVALGQQQKLVAVDVTSELPAELTLPKIGYHRQLSAEGLLALGATRLIGSDEMGPDTTLNQLRSAGVEVDVVNTEPTPEGLLLRVDQIASLLNAQSQAAALKQKIDNQITALGSNKIDDKSAAKVLFLLIHEGRPANVAGRDTTPDAIIKLAGARNPAANQLQSYKPLSTEAIVDMQPDVILVSGRSLSKIGGADEILAKMPMLAATPAGQNKQILPIDGRALVGGLGLKSLSEAERLSALLR